MDVTLLKEESSNDIGNGSLPSLHLLVQSQQWKHQSSE